MIPPPIGTLWLCGTSVYSILPSQFNGRCTLVYVLPAIRENTHSTSSSPHLQNSASTNKDGCIPGLTCVQTWWSRTLGALIPSYCKKGPGWNDPMTAVIPRVKGFACYDLSFSRHNKNIKMEHFFLYILSRYFI